MKLKLTLALACALFVGNCTSAIYTADYMARTLLRQDANTDDYLWKRSTPVPASSTPRPLPVALDASIEPAFEAQLGGEAVTAFMARTDTQSLIVLRGGAIAYERYADGVTASTPQALFSVSKSILSLIVGRALADGSLSSIDDPVTRHIPELRERDPRFDAITLAHLSDMRSGIGFEDDVSFPFVTSDAPLVYYASNLRQVVLRETQIEAAPGRFLYNDYNPNLLALALERAMGEERLISARNALWNALGAEDAALWSIDDHGFPYWESGFVATPRDLGKVGAVMLGAAEQSDAVMPPAWRARVEAFRPTQPSERFDGRQWGYRGGFWHVLRADNRNDIAAIGRFGQMIYVSPRNNVAFIRTGLDENAPSDGTLTALFFAMSDRLGAAN